MHLLAMHIQIYSSLFNAKHQLIIGCWLTLRYQQELSVGCCLTLRYKQVLSVGCCLSLRYKQELSVGCCLTLRYKQELSIGCCLSSWKCSSRRYLWLLFCSLIYVSCEAVVQTTFYQYINCPLVTLNCGYRETSSTWLTRWTTQEGTTETLWSRETTMLSLVGGTGPPAMGLGGMTNRLK